MNTSTDISSKSLYDLNWVKTAEVNSYVHPWQWKYNISAEEYVHTDRVVREENRKLIKEMNRLNEWLGRIKRARQWDIGITVRNVADQHKHECENWTKWRDSLVKFSDFFYDHLEPTKDGGYTLQSETNAILLIDDLVSLGDRFYSVEKEHVSWGDKVVKERIDLQGRRGNTTIISNGGSSSGSSFGDSVVGGMVGAVGGEVICDLLSDD